MARFGMMFQQKGRFGDVRILGRKAVELMATHRLQNVPDFCWGANEKDRKYGLGVDMRKFPGTLYSHGTFLHEGSGHSVLIIDPAEEMVCSCVYPWVNDAFDMDCNSRLYNVIWSGII
jgi:CubicO group peptidase (beta-lactamase class C family)